MAPSATELDARAASVRVEGDRLVISLVDGRVLSIPLGWFPRQQHATAEQLSDWRLIGRGAGIHWEALDEDISVPRLLGLPCDQVEGLRAMRITMRYFAALRETTGREAETLELLAGADVAAAREALLAHYPALERVLPRCAIARNRAYVDAESALADGDELAFIPPVGGG